MRSGTTIAGFSFVLALAAAAGCYSGNAMDPSDPAQAANGTDPARAGADGGSAAQNGASSSSGAGAGGGAATGLPCDVDTLLEQKCRSCHGSPLMAPMPLVTYEDLVAPSKSDPSKTTAAAAIARMRNDASPMPPSGDRATATEIGAMEKWVADGTPKGTCGVQSGGGDGAGAGGGSSSGGSSGTSSPPPTLKCTSGKTYNGSEGPNMNPGRACITCHQKEEGKPIVQIGGTVYPSLLEPDMCLGVNGGATVQITDATGKVFSLPVGPTGNFSLRNATVAMPFKAKVIRADGKERAMGAAQSTGDCNSCHAEQPKNGAPGRILLP